MRLGLDAPAERETLWQKSQLGIGRVIFLPLQAKPANGKSIQVVEERPWGPGDRRWGGARTTFRGQT